MNVLKYIGQQVKVQMDRPLGSRHPEHGFLYPVNYGYLPDVPGKDGEALDAYVLGVNEPLDCFEGECIAVICRIDDEDDKLVVAPAGKEITDREIRKYTAFVERYFRSEIVRKT